MYTPLVTCRPQMIKSLKSPLVCSRGFCCYVSMAHVICCLILILGCVCVSCRCVPVLDVSIQVCVRLRMIGPIKLSVQVLDKLLDLTYMTNEDVDRLASKSLTLIHTHKQTFTHKTDRQTDRLPACLPACLFKPPGSSCFGDPNLSHFFSTNNCADNSTVNRGGDEGSQL